MSNLFPDKPDYLPFPSAVRVARCYVCGKAVPLIAAAAVSYALCPAHEGHHEHIPEQDFTGFVYTTPPSISSSGGNAAYTPGIVDSNDVAIQGRTKILRDGQARIAAAPTDFSWLIEFGSSTEENS
jgi:hypothetical protein